MIENRGELEIRNADDANVPVDIWVSQINNDSFNNGYGDKISQDDIGKWELHANNYMPRRASLAEDCDAYFIVADTKEEIAELIEKYILPLYRVAIEVLTDMAATGKGHLYYWENQNKRG
jgi:hypothetical protein